MSAAVYRDPKLPFSTSNATPLEDDFKDLFEGEIHIDRSRDGGSAGDAEPETKKGTVLRFHYDRTYNIGGETMHVVNIFVPDLYGKALETRVQRIDEEDDDEPVQFDLDDFAAECLGMITILSCAS
ncbi:MAG: hypothetical protein KDK08_27040 [Rhizobiaceae bacterium]|nr:hypothetical protein [Rhizobiaceae bacterium]